MSCAARVRGKIPVCVSVGLISIGQYQKIPPINRYYYFFTWLLADFYASIELVSQKIIESLTFEPLRQETTPLQIQEIMRASIISSICLRPNALESI